MKKIFNFILTLHFHQPVDNFGFVIEKVTKNCYEPLLSTIEDFPDIKFNLHFSGCLLEWLKKYRPDIISKVKKLVSRGQVELVGGGLYEPILSVLPEADAIEQVTMLSQFLKKEFKADISGCWLAERVWEPQLAATLSKANMDYAIIDDAHLRYAGLSEDKLYGHYITELDGHTINILPSNMFLRFSIPFKPHKVTLDYLYKVRDSYGKNFILYGDDAEKFGAWPNTYEHVYKKKWLYKFLRLLQKNSSWLKTTKISDYLKSESPLGRVYIPCASYQEMNQWALPVDFEESLESIINTLRKQGQLDNYMDFLRGGFWRNFFVKYPESNHIHKRALMASKRLRRLEAIVRTPHSTQLKLAKNELFKSQCNCAYWHGLFGGLYIYHLRASLYKHLIASEQILDKIEYKKKAWLEVKEEDFDCDGNKEFIISTSKNTFVVDLAEGASLTEWSLKAKPVNIINTLTRRKEIYHKGLKNLSYDEYRRSGLRDRFLSSLITLSEEGDFANSIYHRVKKFSRKGSYTIELERDGFAGKKGVRLKKSFIFYPDKDKLDVGYIIKNLTQKPVELNFAPELNFSITDDAIEEAFSKIEMIRLEDNIENLNINISFSQAVDKLIRYPVRTISKSERYFQEHYQATCILPIFTLSLDKNKSKSIGLSIEVD
ncbi:MAG: DUF1926 domain-containing protein [Candidatus Omnitrophica bacterium]|nr:DUF1926 domain-containing protein [Candidatus Omnitrophota bacterium]